MLDFTQTCKYKVELKVVFTQKKIKIEKGIIPSGNFKTEPWSKLMEASSKSSMKGDIPRVAFHLTDVHNCSQKDH